MSAHTGRCFRAWRRLKARRERQGAPPPVFPIRQKVPLALRPFLTGDGRQTRVDAQGMANAIARYAQHQTAVGKIQKASARGR
jgi:hypothetical protein